MLFGLIQRRHHLRVLHALRADGPQRFNDLKAATGLESAQLSRVLKSLMLDLLVIAATIPTRGDRIPLEYRASRRALRILEVWDQMHAVVHDDPGVEARRIDREMESLVG